MLRNADPVPAGGGEKQLGARTEHDFVKPTAASMAVVFLFHRDRAAEAAIQIMNTSTTELEPYDNPAAVGAFAINGGFAGLWRLYQELGLNPEQALAAARADVACGLKEAPASSNTR